MTNQKSPTSLSDVWNYLASKSAPRDVAFDRSRIVDTLRYVPMHLMFFAAFCLVSALLCAWVEQWHSYAFWLLPLFATLFIASPLLFVRGILKNRYLMKYGVLVKGKVTWKLWLRYGSMTRAEYEIDGKLYQEHTENDYFSIDEREKDEVILLVDPKNPHVATIYGRGFFIIR